MDEKSAKSVFEKYSKGKATEEEKALLDAWYLQRQAKNAPNLSDKELEEMEFNMLFALQKPKKSTTYRWYWAAAALFIVGLFLATPLFHKDIHSVPPLVRTDVAPGKSNAFLILPNGKKLQLKEDKKGVKIDFSQLKYDDGTILDAQSLAEANQNDFITAQTPSGGEYQVTLPDGSRIWLNSETEIRFAKTFVNGERRIFLKGEAYLEVKKSYETIKGKKVRRPFYVETDNQIIEVLGTSFNVNAYKNESSTATTLVEGSVKLAKKGINGITATLKPGQQSTLNNNSSEFVIAEANIAKAIAWKQGYFYFDNDNIYSVMRQLSRWYNVTAEFKVKRLDDQFVGEISRYSKLSEVLKMLQFGGVKLRIEENKIIIN